MLKGLFHQGKGFVEVRYTCMELTMDLYNKQATDEDRAKRTVWSKAQTQFLQASAIVLRENPRASCLVASVVNKYCYQVCIQLPCWLNQ